MIIKKLINNLVNSRIMKKFKQKYGNNINILKLNPENIINRLILFTIFKLKN